MRSRTWIAVTVFWLTLGGSTAPIIAQQPQGSDRPLANFDIRDRELPGPSAAADRQGAARGQRRSRVNPHTGALRIVDATDLAIGRGLPPEGIRTALTRVAGRLGLDEPTSSRSHRSATSRARRTMFVTSCSARQSMESVCSMRRFRFMWTARVERFASRRAQRVGRAAATRV